MVGDEVCPGAALVLGGHGLVVQQQRRHSPAGQLQIQPVLTADHPVLVHHPGKHPLALPLGVKAAGGRQRLLLPPLPQAAQEKAVAGGIGSVAEFPTDGGGQLQLSAAAQHHPAAHYFTLTFSPG